LKDSQKINVQQLRSALEKFIDKLKDNKKTEQSISPNTKNLVRKNQKKTKLGD